MAIAQWGDEAAVTGKLKAAQNRPMRILQIGNWPPPVCGWAMNLVALRAELASRGWECAVMNLNENRRVKSPDYIDVQDGLDYLRKTWRMVTRGYRRREHVIVSNVDQILIVSAIEAPGLKLPLIDRYLISAERGGVRPIVILNKSDLADLADYQWIVGLYTQLGYETLEPASVPTGLHADAH